MSKIRWGAQLSHEDYDKLQASSHLDNIEGMILSAGGETRGCWSTQGVHEDVVVSTSIVHFESTEGIASKAEEQHLETRTQSVEIHSYRSEMHETHCVGSTEVAVELGAVTVREDASRVCYKEAGDGDENAEGEMEIDVGGSRSFLKRARSESTMQLSCVQDGARDLKKRTIPGKNVKHTTRDAEDVGGLEIKEQTVSVALAFHGTAEGGARGNKHLAGSKDAASSGVQRHGAGLSLSRLEEAINLSDTLEQAVRVGDAECAYSAVHEASLKLRGKEVETARNDRITCEWLVGEVLAQVVLNGVGLLERDRCVACPLCILVCCMCVRMCRHHTRTRAHAYGYPKMHTCVRMFLQKT
jgi:hypothetical protein